MGKCIIAQERSPNSSESVERNKFIKKEIIYKISKQKNARYKMYRAFLSYLFCVINLQKLLLLDIQLRKIRSLHIHHQLRVPQYVPSFEIKYSRHNPIRCLCSYNNTKNKNKQGNRMFFQKYIKVQLQLTCVRKSYHNKGEKSISTEI